MAGDRRGRASSLAAHPELGRALPGLRGRARRCCSPRTRPTRERLFGVPEPRRRTSRTASTTTSSTAEPDAVNPEQTGTKAAAHYRADGRAPGSRESSGCGCTDAAAPVAARGPVAARSAPTSTRSFEARRRRGRRVLRDGHPARRSTPTRRNVMRQALAGMLWSKQFYYYDVDRWLEERGADPFEPTRHGGAAQRPLAPHVQRRHHLDAGQVGVPLVRGVGPGLPRPRADARRRGLRQAAARPDAARALPAPERPDAGLRVELRRRQSAGPRLGDDLHLPPGEGAHAARATSTGSSASSRSCCSTSPGGSTARTARAATSSRAASSASTTSASSTAARRCRPAATWSRPTARPGWRCSARTCSRSPSSWRMQRPAYADMAAEVRRALPVDRRPSMMHAGGDTGMWDEEDGFFYDVLRLPDGQAAAAQGPVDGRPAAALRGHRVRGRAPASGIPSSPSGLRRFLEARPELRAFIHDPVERAASGGRRLGGDPRRDASCAACWRGCSTRTSS